MFSETYVRVPFSCKNQKACHQTAAIWCFTSKRSSPNSHQTTILLLRSPFHASNGFRTVFSYFSVLLNYNMKMLNVLPGCRAEKRRMEGQYFTFNFHFLCILLLVMARVLEFWTSVFIQQITIQVLAFYENQHTHMTLR